MFVLLVSQAVEKGDSGYQEILENVMPLSAASRSRCLFSSEEPDGFRRPPT